MMSVVLDTQSTMHAIIMTMVVMIPTGMTAFGMEPIVIGDRVHMKKASILDIMTVMRMQFAIQRVQNLK